MNARANRPTEPRYRLESRIATGGMGEVWRATDTVLGREVAVKVLKAEYADDPAFRSRFAAEARHAGALHHPNVASVFDFGDTDPAGTGIAGPFLVMELVPGKPLSVLLRGEPMASSAAAHLVAQAADGLAAAHALGIVHRDVKPANLLVTPEGQVKVTDFGISRAKDSVPLTVTGQIVGTPHYLSPEQVEGASATMASDIYSLGVVLFECLTGQRPFVGDTPITTALAHLRDPVPPLPDDVPPWLQAVVARTLAKDPAERFASAADLAVALRNGPAAPEAAAPVAAVTQLLSRPPDHPQPARRSRLSRLSWLAAAAALVLVVAVVTALNRGGPDRAVADGAAVPSAATGSAAADQRVRVRNGDLVGTPVSTARQRIRALGLRVRVQLRDNTGSSPAGVVTDVRPTGLVRPDARITLVAWGPAPVVRHPATTPAPKAEPGPGKGAANGKQEPQKHGKPGKAKGKK